MNGRLIAVETTCSIVIDTREVLRVTYQAVKTEEISRGFNLNLAVGMTSATQLLQTSDFEIGISDAFESNLKEIESGSIA